MKATLLKLTCFSALCLQTALAQPRPPQPGVPPPPPSAPGEPASAPGLSKFNLEFPGGTPKQLLAAIEKASGHPVNAIIPEDTAETSLPPLKLTGIDVPQLFQALMNASRKQEVVVTSPPGSYGNPSYQYVSTGYGFRQASEGRPTGETIWYFYVDRPAIPPYSPLLKICRVYSLAPHLDHGLKVGDITEAIETAYKMLGETSPPKVNYQRETKLLIAVGEPNKLDTIEAVLRALEPVPPGGGGTGFNPVTRPQNRPTPGNPQNR